MATITLTSASILCWWFGAGKSPKAPGTMGSIATLPLCWLLHSYFGPWGPLWLALLTFGLGWWASSVYMKLHQRDDPSEIVIDEVSGQALLLAFMPLSLTGYVIGLLLFRLFDILKPWPICWLDRNVKGAFGVMIDDTAAALFALLVWACIWWIAPENIRAVLI